MRPPQGIGEVAGWVGASFLVGLAAHALAPDRPVSTIALSIVVMIALLLGFASSSKTWPRIFAVCLLACALGVWRYDVNRATQPRGLVPFSPKGLAFVTSEVRVSDPHDPRYWLGRARDSLTRLAQERFIPDQSALLTGILYGERDFSRELKEAFRRAGLLHLVAVSGSNVTIVTVIAMRFLLAFRLSRRRAFAALTLLLVVFVLFVSPSASVVRAALMGWLLEFAPIVGRLPRPSRLLLIAAVVFSAWKPWALLYDASFALSFLAMWGLLTFTPWIDERLEPVMRWKETRAILSSTIGATLLTLPYAAWAFGQASFIGLVTNLLVLPAVPFAMATGALALAAPPGSWLTWPAQGFLQWMIEVARHASALNIGVWATRGMSIVAMFGWYAFLGGLWVFRGNGDNNNPQNSVSADPPVARG